MRNNCILEKDTSAAHNGLTEVHTTFLETVFTEEKKKVLQKPFVHCNYTSMHRNYSPPKKFLGSDDKFDHSSTLIPYNWGMFGKTHFMSY